MSAGKYLGISRARFKLPAVYSSGDEACKWKRVVDAFDCLGDEITLCFILISPRKVSAMLLP